MRRPGNGRRAPARSHRPERCRAAPRPPALRIASIWAITSPRLGDCGGWPNSLMSAPAKKVRPAQAITTASTDASSPARRSAATSPARTACFSALTGGLSAMTIAMPPSRRRSTLALILPIPSLPFIRRLRRCATLMKRPKVGRSSAVALAELADQCRDGIPWVSGAHRLAHHRNAACAGGTA